MTQRDRRDRTERAIVEAATALFLEDGYARTTLAAVAKRAGVADRTVYLRFGSKVTLFQRVVEAGVVGDTDDTPLPQRPWSIRSFTAPTLDERIVAFAEGVSDMNERLGPLMAVNGELEASEPAVQQSAGRARADTFLFLGAFWESAARDGLLPDGCDLEWLISTSTVLAAAETRLLISRTLHWERGRFRDWLYETWWRLLSAAVVHPPR